MNKRKMRRSVSIRGAAGLLLVGTFVLGTRYRQHHDLLDRRLVGAVLGNNYRLATTLIREGADPNARYGPPQPLSMRHLWKVVFHRSTTLMDERATAFSLACGGHNDPDELKKWHDRSEPAELVRTMLKNGANVNEMGAYRTTPLFWAVRESNPKIVSVLLEYGADVNARDSNRYTPLMDACQSSPTTLHLLLAHGADVNATADGGHTPLLLATRIAANPDKILLLLDHGASVNAQSNDGSSALYRAVEMSASTRDRWTTSVIPQLLAHGANTNLAIRNGTTPLQVAQENNRPDLVALIRHVRAGKERTPSDTRH